MVYIFSQFLFMIFILTNKGKHTAKSFCFVTTCVPEHPVIKSKAKQTMTEICLYTYSRLDWSGFHLIYFIRLRKYFFTSLIGIKSEFLIIRKKGKNFSL